MNQPRFNALEIETPEGITFEYLLASPLVRCMALAIDYLTIATLFLIISALIEILGWISVDIATAFYIIFYFALSIGYFLILEFGWKGKTIGKKLFNLKVMDSRGFRLRLDQVVMRNLMRFVDSLPLFYCLGGVVSLINRRSQRLGDIIAGTVVVRAPDREIPKLSEISDTEYNSFSEHPRMEALLRERVSPIQAKIALQALQRRDSLEPTARIKLFADLAAHFKAVVVFPGDSADILTDEQYVKNCVESIFRGAK
ncbi:MAG: RDD family protein [Verrucomicrobiota bacterium]